MTTRPGGIKARVSLALSTSTVAMTMGEVIQRADIPKTSAAEVSSVLYKLRNAGQVRTVRGPSTSANGPRFVRKYVWVVRVAKEVEKPLATVFSGLNVIGR